MRLSELIDRAEAGEQVVIARDGKPIVALTPLQAIPARKPPVRFGRLAHLGPILDPESLFVADDDLEATMDEPLPKPWT